MVRMIRRLSALSSTTAILRIYSNHITLLSRRIGASFFDALSSRAAGLIRPEWVNAYGKFPRASPCRPQVIRITQHLLESESGYHQPPVLAKHSTSQNVHVQKTLSSLTSCRVDKGCPSLTTSACRPSWKSSVGRTSGS